MQQFRCGLVFKAHSLLYHSILGSKVTKTKKTCGAEGLGLLSIDRLTGMGTTRTEDAQATPAPSHISPSTLVIEDN